MMLSEHKGALALAGCLFTRPGLPGQQTIKKRQGTVPCLFDVHSADTQLYPLVKFR